MATHTPGPWTVRERSDDYTEGYFIEAVDRDVCTVAVAGHTDKVQLANARLIATAPEMLALLRQIVDACAIAADSQEYDEDARALLARIAGEGVGRDA